MHHQKQDLALLEYSSIVAINGIRDAVAIILSAHALPSLRSRFVQFPETVQGRLVSHHQFAEDTRAS